MRNQRTRKLIVIKNPTMSILIDFYDRLQLYRPDTSSIVLDETTVPNDADGNPHPVLSLLRQAFDTDQTLVVHLSEPLAWNNPLVVQGTATLLQAEAAVTATFTQSSGPEPQLQLFIKAVLPRPTDKEGWYFSTSFPNFSRTPLDRLNILNPEFYFASYPHESAEVFFPLQEGLHFQSELLLANDLRPITADTSPANTQRIRIGGPIGMEESFPSMALTADTDQMGDLTVNLLGTVPLTLRQANLAISTFQTSLLGKVSALGREIDVRMNLPTQSDREALGLTFTGPIPIPSLGEVVRLVGGDDLASIFPVSFLEVSGLAITEMAFHFHPMGLGRTAASLSLGATDPETGWTLSSSPHMSLKNFALELYTRTHKVNGDRFYRSYSGSVFGIFQFNDALQVEVSVSVSDRGDWLLRIEQESDRPHLQDLVDWIGQSDSLVLDALPDVVRSTPSVALRSVEVSVHPFSPTRVNFISFLIEQTAPWVIVEGVVSVEDWSIALTLTNNPQSWGTYGTLEGTVLLGSVPMTVTIPIPLSETATLGMSEAVELPSLGDLAQLLGGDELSSLLPDNLDTVGGFMLQDLQMEFTLSPTQLERLSFSLRSYQDWVILADRLILKDVNIEMNIQDPLSSGRGVTASIGGSLLLGKTEVFVMAERDSDGAWGISAGAGILSLPSLADMAQLIGSDTFDRMLTVFPDSIVNGHVHITDLDLQATVDDQGSRFQGVGFALSLGSASTPEEDSIWGNSLRFSVAANDDINPDKGMSVQITMGQQLPIGTLLADLAGKFGLADQDFPQALESLVFHDLAVAFNTATKDFSFSGGAMFDMGGKEVAITVSIAITRDRDGNYSKTFTGQLALGSRTFDVVFDSDPAGTSFIAAYSHDGSQEPIALKELVGHLSEEVAAPIPDSLTLGLQQILLAVDRQTVGNRSTTRFVLGIKLGLSLDLRELPLVGGQLPQGTQLGIEDLQCILASAALTEAEVGDLNALLPDHLSPLPSKNIAAKRPQIGATMALNGEVIPLEVPMLSTTVETEGLLTQDTAPEGESAFIPNTPTTEEEGIKWFDLNKQLGPMALKRLGMQYQEGSLRILLDADLSAGPLTISLQGLGAGSPLDRFHPQFQLSGLGLEYAKPPTEISGTFLRDLQQDAYTGAITIRTPSLSIVALGAYQEVNGQPSIFIYAVADLVKGIGPPFLELQGLCVGFGYNRSLRMPDVHGIRSFPLVSVARGDADYGDDPIAVLQQIRGVVPASRGDLFMAFGIKFNSFKMLDSFALLILRLGNRTVLDLLGLSKLRVPSRSAKPLAEATLALKASYDFDEGSLKVIGVLTPDSYALSKQCVLTGGFAFYSWMAGPHAGDFALTLGGYHPDFVVPAHYPRVPRLGFHWQLSDALNIRGGMYFTLTPHALMAGGRLEALFEKRFRVGFDIGIAGAELSGTVRAYLIIGADLIISWEPYFYQADLYLSVGISAVFRGRVRFLGFSASRELRFDLSLSAGLRIWGPEFSGIAHVDWSVVSFDVRFGSGSPTTPPPLSWSAFRQAFLPGEDALCTVSIQQGLLREDPTGVRVVNPAALVLTTNSVIPATTSNMGHRGKGFGIAPMDLRSVDSAEHRITLVDMDDNERDVTDEFVMTPIEQPLPAALWGDTFGTSVDGERLLPDMLTGFTITPKPKQRPEQTEERLVSDFAYDVALRSGAFTRQTPLALAYDPADDAGRRTFLQGIGDRANQRDLLLTELGLDTGAVRLHALGQDTEEAFLVAPEVVTMLN